MIISLLIGASSAQFNYLNDWTAYPDKAYPWEIDNWDEDLKCSHCIIRGHVFCHKGKDREQYDAVEPEHHCCKSISDCPMMFNPEWRCSSDFAHKDYALAMCPQDIKKCGINNKFVLSTIGSYKYATPAIAKMEKGDTCTYEVETKCGSPYFMAHEDSKIYEKEKLRVSFLEWDRQRMKKGGRDETMASLDQRKVNQPNADLPQRGQFWANAGM